MYLLSWKTAIEFRIVKRKNNSKSILSYFLMLKKIKKNVKFGKLVSKKITKQENQFCSYLV